MTAAVTAAPIHASALLRPACSLWDFVAVSGLQALVLGTSKDPNAKLTILLVSPETAEAVLVAKAPTTDIAERAVEAEARFLVDICHALPSSIDSTVPRVVETVEFDGRLAIVTTAVPGTTLASAYARRGHTASRVKVAGDFDAVGGWIRHMQEATAGALSPLELDDGVLSRLERRFDGDRGLRADLDRLAAMHARLREARVPRTVVHGDFWHGNILVRDGRVSGVVDWEAAVPVGEPVRDLARFAHMYALYLDRRARNGRRIPGHRGLRADRWGVGVEHALLGGGWFPEVFRAFLADGLARLGASPADWRLVACAAIAEVAALTDHEEFARLHLELFRRVAPAVGGG